jgi:hypothetical protein
VIQWRLAALIRQLRRGFADCDARFIRRPVNALPHSQITAATPSR